MKILAKLNVYTEDYILRIFISITLSGLLFHIKKYIHICSSSINRRDFGRGLRSSRHREPRRRPSSPRDGGRAGRPAGAGSASQVSSDCAEYVPPAFSCVTASRECVCAHARRPRRRRHPLAPFAPICRPKEEKWGGRKKGGSSVARRSRGIRDPGSRRAWPRERRLGRARE